MLSVIGFQAFYNGLDVHEQDRFIEWLDTQPWPPWEDLEAVLKMRGHQWVYYQYAIHRMTSDRCGKLRELLG